MSIEFDNGASHDKQPTVSGHVEPVVSSYCDGKGVEFKEFDVVKVFHFTGVGRKKHYMYKWILTDDKGRLCFKHLSDDKEELVWLSIVCKSTLNGYVWIDSEIVQSNSC